MTKIGAAVLAATLFGPSLAPAAVLPRAAVEAKFAAVNRHDIDAIVAAYALDAQVTAADFCKPRQGRADVERTYRTIFAAVPDVQVELTDIVAEGPRVAVRFVLHSKAFSVPIMNFFTVENGLITRDDGLFNNGGRPCTP